MVDSRGMILDLTAEQQAFKASIEQFARDVVAPRAAAIDETRRVSRSMCMRAAAPRGLLGVTIPNAWGGAGRDYVSYVLAIEAIARASATVAAALSVTNSLVAELVAHAGRAPQKEQWLRQLATGDGDRRVRAVGGRRRHRRGQSADQGGQGRRRLPHHRPEGLGRQRRRRVGGDRLRVHARRACAARA